MSATAIADTATAWERRLRTLLRVLGAGLLLAALIYAAGPLVGPMRSFFRETPFVANSVVKVSVLGLACLYAAGDVRRRAAVIGIVIAAHLVSVAAMGAVLAFGETGRQVDMGFLGHPSVATVLWGAIALDGVITTAVAVLFLLARISARHAPTVPEDPPAPLTAPERRFRTLALVLGVLFALGATAYLAGALLDGTRDAFVELPFVTNSVVKVAALSLLLLYVARDVGRNLPLAGPVVAVHLLSPLVSFAYLFSAGDRTLAIFDWHPRVSTILWGAIALDGAIGILLLLACRAAWQARVQTGFFAPAQYRALLALADTLLAGEDEQISPRDIAANVEDYVGQVRAKRTWVYRVALLAAQYRPLLSALPPLSEIEPGARRAFLVERFLHPPRWPRFAKNVTQIVIRVGQQLVFAGYYADRRTWPSIGYTPYSERGRPGVKRPPLDLHVERPEDVDGTEIEADVCVVGSGAGGAILAYELAKRGRDVLILEKGPYVQPHEFTENEVEMIGQLYGDGVMQQTEDFRFTVLQGGCVGGSTTVNNAVCFRPPERVLARWNDPREHDAGLELGELAQSLDAVERFLDVHSQHEAVLNPSYPKYVGGATAAGFAPGALDVDVVRANIRDCLGCGYCNIGCAYGRKLSMLDVTLPAAQRDFPGKVRILAECEVERLRTRSGSPKRVADVRARLRDGRQVTIAANDVVLSAGAIASSYLLLRSGVGAGPLPFVRGLPVGRGLCFNMGAPLTAEFPEPMQAYDGLQISHYGRPVMNGGFVFETWFNPPVAQALNMPGWFERHFENMRRYDHLMAVGVLVGTEGNARVTRALTGGAGISYRPAPGDLRTLGRGLRTLGEILFAAGATRVMLNSWGYDEFHAKDELGRIDELVMDPDYVTLGTGHPQGGNALGRDPRHSVVGPDFKVHGYENLHVCDASVFPGSLTVNPQLTVMGLAHYAAARIA